MTNPFDLNIDFDNPDHDAEENRRQRIRVLIDKMDLPQLEIMLGIAMSSVNEKDRELNKLLSPTKKRRRKK